MIIKIIIFISFTILLGQANELTVQEIISAMDENLNAKSRVMTSKMIVHGRRSSRTIESKNWVVGINQAFTEYLSPPREAGTKMLKLDDKLWTYSPQTDRVIQISGHMLRQSVMGSDMSYNDMMEDKEYLLPIKEELYAKSGKLLKTATMDGIKKTQGRWFPSRYLFKDELKRNSKGTEWHIDDIKFDVDIPDRRFTKSNLRK